MASLTDLFALPGQPPFRPFLPGEQVDNGDGSYSTERLITWQTPDGQWVNTPTLFQTANGVLDLSTAVQEAQARRAAEVLGQSGMSFPTFNTLPEAESWAQNRSAGGGASHDPLFGWWK